MPLDLPGAAVSGGRPACGRHAGAIARIDWAGLRPRPGWLWRRLHHKRWHYVGLGERRGVPRRRHRRPGLGGLRFRGPGFSGEVRASAGALPRRVYGLLGVTEDHRSRW
ncbi:MAG: hypothetical protein QM788_18340 [Roseateles sp.]|uniref:hypothetical protein n=1 Tax=Roseateles sp. TaxID=1971397 RepID=UPI0039E86F2F